MWTRRELKSNAKQELKFSYWVSFAVCLVSTFIMGGSGGASSSGSGADELADSVVSGNFIPPGVIAGIVGIVLFAALIGILINVFIVNAITVGKCSFFIRAPYGDRKFSNLFSSFSGGRFMPSVKAMFMANLFICLWSFLLIIPGIVKAYQYRLVPYIISDDPSLSSSQVLELSRRMTDGEKWRMFVLDLSFIGWYLLVPITLGLGVLFIAPYVEATWAQFYFAVRPKVSTTAPDMY